MRVVALVPAAGLGHRLGAAVPKALVRVNGLPLLTHTIVGLLNSDCVDDVMVAGPPDALSLMEEAVRLVGVRSSVVTVVPGGADRSASVLLALKAATEQLPAFEVVLVHDAARAFTPAPLIATVVDAVRMGAPAVIPVLPVVDTVKMVDAAGTIRETVDRSTLRIVQTPQGFSAEVLRKAHESGLAATDDAGLVERLGIAVRTVPGHPDAMKITTPFDLAIAEAVLARRRSAEI